MVRHDCALRLAVAGTRILVSTSILAATIHVQINDATDKPLADTIVYAEPITATLPSKVNQIVEIEQKGRKFIPLVNVVQTGTEISFPNKDTVHHPRWRIDVRRR